MDVEGSGWHSSRARTTGKRRAGDSRKDTESPASFKSRHGNEGFGVLSVFQAELAGCPTTKNKQTSGSSDCQGGGDLPWKTTM